MTAPFAWVDFIPATKQSLDKDGFLLCRDVPVARTGVQLYGPGETPIDSVTGDVVRIERTEDEVFHPECLGSLQGAVVVNDHPVDGNGQRCDVTPDNWPQLAVGHVENPRRGDGIFTDFILADLRIKHRDAIDLISSGKRQVSCGYDADYEELGPNHGRQKNIRCNHLALVDAARCGPVCSIGDENTVDGKEVLMTTSVTTTPWERIRGLAKQYSFKARDQAELESAIADAEEEEEKNGNGTPPIHVHTHLENGNGDARRSRDEEGEEKKDDDKDKAEDRKARDAQDLENEELWEAIESLERAAVLGGADGYKPRDSRPARDARRSRMGIDAKPRDNGDPDDPDKDKDKGEDEEGANLGGGSTPILREFEMEAPAGAQVVDVRKARDSRYLEESWQTTIAKGEIIVPGSRPTGTFDRAAPREKTYDAICGYRRAVLDMAFMRPETRNTIDSFTRGHFTTGSKLSCAKVRELFDHIAEVRRVANNNGTGGSRAVRDAAADGPVAMGGVNSIADLQKQLTEHYAQKT